jgi:glycosyltransferase involved in cell wall biosynthesis
MRILIVHNRYRQFGGEDAVVDGEAEMLRLAGHEVCVLMWSNDDIEIDGLFRRAAALRNAIWNPAAWRMVRDARRDFAPDIVHVHNTVAVASPAVLNASRGPGVGIVHTLHNFRHLCLNGMLFRNQSLCTDCVGKLPWRGAVRSCYRGSRSASVALAGSEVIHRALGTWTKTVHRFIALSEHSRGLHIAGGLDPDRIAVKPQTLARDPGCGNHRGDYALFAGRLSPEKGVSVLIQAWRREGLTVPLVIAGDGPEADRVRRETASLPTVHMMGRVPRHQLLSLMKDARVLVLPSVWFESALPVTLLEGLATGCPVVASRLGAIPEMVREGEEGILVPPGDPDAIARAIRELWQSEASRQRLGAGARAAFRERYSPEASRGVLLRIYGEASEMARSKKNGRAPL